MITKRKVSVQLEPKIKQGILGGIAATVVMTAFMMIAPIMGMPKMSPPEILATMMSPFLLKKRW